MEQRKDYSNQIPASQLAEEAENANKAAAIADPGGAPDNANVAVAEPDKPVVFTIQGVEGTFSGEQSVEVAGDEPLVLIDDLVVGDVLTHFKRKVTAVIPGDGTCLIETVELEPAKPADLKQQGTGNAGGTPSAADLDAVAAEHKAKEAVAQQSVETKEYADGTVVTGVAPLPDKSPAEQAAEEQSASPVGPAGDLYVSETQGVVGISDGKRSCRLTRPCHSKNGRRRTLTASQ